MRIAISNLAWDISNDEEIATLLNIYKVDAIDVAPGKYFPNISSASASDIERVCDWWRSRGITITGMQSLLFGTSGFNLFGDRDKQESMLTHLDAICRIGSGLGATRLVFGSPKNRDRSLLSEEQTHSTSVAFFFSDGLNYQNQVRQFLYYKKKPRKRAKIKKKKK
jgi:D-psicose/D-tagatose/L-ribulose 3-epimerase